MSLEQLISFFNESIEEQLPNINKSLNDITGNELEISFSDLNSGNSEMYLSENTLPFISMDFTSNGLFHQIIVPAEKSSKLTELLGTPIEGDLSEEHLILLKSITENITSTFIDSGLNLANIEIIDNSDSLNIPNNLQNQKLILRSGDEIIELNLYHWDNQGDLMEDTTLEVQQADFGELDTANGSMADNKIDMLLEVELDVTIELGRKKMSIQEVLQLGKGTVIELTKLAGEPVDIYVNQKPLAKGEVVVVDENFAIRITNLVDKSERLKSLGK